ncbi:MAG: DUF1697 domain-containing protein [Chthoniobacterales bacterium]
MPRYIAFLRAINVGGRVIKMEELRRVFAAAGLTNVESFIASGNVLFDTRVTSEQALRKKVEAALAHELGYRVDTFLRDPQEVKRIAAFQAFPPSSFRTAQSRLFIGFLGTALERETAQRLVRLSSETDEFRVDGRELYWLCHVPASESDFSGPKLEKTIGQATTVRNVNTVRRLAAKLG